MFSALAASRRRRRGQAGVLDWLIEFVWRIGPWGYVVVFLGAALESAAFLGLLVPGESLVIVSGVLAATGLFELPTLIAVVSAGAVTGDSIGYELGRQLGRPWLLRRGARLGFHPDRLEAVEAFFERHGGKAVLIGRFIGFLRALAPFVAGSARMPYPRFLAYNVVGAILWTVACVLLGYFVGAAWPIVERWVGRIGLVLGLVVVAVATWWLRQRGRRRSRPS
jgi:membrane protein DedA with SNARE-associated domain